MCNYLWLRAPKEKGIVSRLQVSVCRRNVHNSEQPTKFVIFIIKIGNYIFTMYNTFVITLPDHLTVQPIMVSSFIDMYLT